MELNEWVRLARKHKGWTLVQLAEALDRSKSNVGLWEQGHHSPSYNQVLQIAAETGFPLPHEVEFEKDGKLVKKSRLGDSFRGLGISVLGEASIDEDSVLDWNWPDLESIRRGSPSKVFEGRLTGIVEPDSFAIRIKGDGGAPIIKHHQFIAVREEGRPGFGDLCLVKVEFEPVRILEFLNEQMDAWMFMTLKGKRITIDKNDSPSFRPIFAIASQSMWSPDFGRP